MAAALAEDGFHAGLELGQHLDGHKGLHRTGKAAAVDATAPLPPSRCFAAAMVTPTS